MKKIYKITFNKVNYDQFDSFIVLADNESEVMAMVKKEYPSKYEIDWEGGYVIKEIAQNENKILLGSFNAG